ncbi:hypothetical protein TWF696_009144 [Orbilia brochopaga]|uniref:CFEM domain-containing protein n=1 Tax=Orbilia brochopaga TaxID=3140254 RepID=A0AAV9UID3_9PEZI
MKFSAVLLVAAAAAVSAQSIADIPSCAQGCLITALGTTGCDVTDLKCSCGNEKFVNDGAACIDKTCGDADIKKARAATIALCGKAGVTINPPSKGDDTPAPASSSAAPAPASSSEAPAPVSSSEAAPAPVSSAPATSSAAVVAPGYGGVTTSTTSRVAAPSVAPPSGNGTVSQPPAPIQTGAAAAIAGNALLALGGAVAAFFL